MTRRTSREACDSKSWVTDVAAAPTNVEAPTSGWETENTTGRQECPCVLPETPEKSQNLITRVRGQPRIQETREAGCVDQTLKCSASFQTVKPGEVP